MKRNLFLISCLILFSLITTGCASTEVESKEVELEKNSSLVQEAVDQGKLALVDGDFKKAKSNFELVLLEDTENNEAKQWIEIIEQYNQFIYLLDKKEIDKAAQTLNELKSNNKYALIEGSIIESENDLNKLIEDIKKIDIKIAALSNLYNPEDENSMPSEDYLYYIDEILTDSSITANQKKIVEDFEKEATERVNSILAKMEEEMKAAETEVIEAAQDESSINGITAAEASTLALRLPSYSDLVANGDTFSEPRVYEGTWIIDISRPNGLAEGSIIVDENRTVSFMYPNGEVDEITPY